MRTFLALFLSLGFMMSAYAGINKAGFIKSTELDAGFIKISGEAAMNLFKYLKDNGHVTQEDPNIVASEALVCWTTKEPTSVEYYCSALIGKDGSVNAMTIDGEIEKD